MRSVIFNKLLIALLGMLISISAFSQIQVQGGDPAGNNISGENPFFDASTSFDMSLDPTSAGKGLVFPRTNLTQWEFKVDNLYVGGSYFPTAFDGMIVYNIGTGNTLTTGNNPSTSTAVTPGFYYFSNPTGINDMTITSGKWIRLLDKNDQGKTPSGSTLPTIPGPSAGDVFYNTTTQSLYYFKDTEWVTVSTVPKGNTLPLVGDSKTGEIFYLTNVDPALSVLKIFNGTAWVTVGSGFIASGTTLPTQPIPVGSTYYKTDTKILYISDGAVWDPVSSAGTGATLPGSAVAGDTFFNTATNNLYYYNGTDWVAVSNIPNGATLPLPANSKLGDAFYLIGTPNLLEIFNGTDWVSVGAVKHDATLTGDGLSTDLSLADNAVNSLKISDGTIANVDLDKANIPISGFGNAGANVSMGNGTVNYQINNLLNPTAAQDAATKAYVDGVVGNSAFDANKIITRTGLDGITGQNFNTATVTDFLNKLFFPVLSPTITSFRYNANTTAGQYSYQTADPDTKVVTDHVGTVTIPYSTWNGLGNVVFNYDISKRDGTSSITKVELFKSGVSQGTVVDGAISGTFSLATAGFTNIDATQNIPMTLTITDNASNVVNLLLNTSFTAANGVSLSNARISTSSGGAALTTSEGSGTVGDPYLIERTGSSFNYFFNWAITPNDDNGAVTNIEFSGTPALVSLSGANITQTSIAATFPHSDALTVYRAGARARGSVANDWSSIIYSQYYQLQDKLYCGYLPATTAPSGNQIKALQQSSLKTTSYYSTNGVTLTNNTGSSGFFTWAVPTYVDGMSPAPTFSRTAYYYATGQWFTNSNVTVHTVPVSIGGTTSWYWVCIYNASAANGASVQAKLSN